MKPLFLNEETYGKIGTCDNRAKSIEELVTYELEEADILEVEKFMETEFVDGFFLVCTECENASKELHKAAAKVMEREECGFYAPFRKMEDALEMVVDKDCLGIDPFHFVGQYKTTSPKLKHPFLYSCESGITAQYFHIEDYPTILELIKN